MNRTIIQADSEILMDAGIFMTALAGIIMDNLEMAEEGNPFLNPYRLDGLMRGLKIIGGKMCTRSELLTELIDKDELERERVKLTQAARERCQGRDSNLGSGVEAECGRARAV